jgi:hypothetical protein
MAATGSVGCVRLARQQAAPSVKADHDQARSPAICRPDEMAVKPGKAIAASL